MALMHSRAMQLSGPMLMAMAMETTVLETMRMTVRQSAEPQANSADLAVQTQTVMGMQTLQRPTQSPKERTHS
jgi:hypothetical protein